jgi:hypothetical protein
MRDWLFLLAPPALIFYFIVFPDRFYAFVSWARTLIGWVTLGQRAGRLVKRNADSFTVGPNDSAMLGFRFAIDGQSKDFWQSESGSNMKTCAGHRQVVNSACKFLSRRTEFDDATPMRGDAAIISAIGHS